MIESGLYFALGFLAAGFLALLVAPSIWRRAAFLTRKRIESAIPLTANELQAEKDKQRAEYAIAVRKVEFDLDKQRSKVTAQALQINELEEQVKLSKAEAASQQEANSQLEKTMAMVSGKLEAREKEVQDLQFQLSTTAAELSARAGELESVTRLYQELENKFSETAEIDKQSQLQIAKLTTSIADMRGKRQADQAKVRETRAEGKATAELLKNERARSRQLETKYERIVAQKSDIEDKLARREKELARLRDKKQGEQADTHELEHRLADSEAERASLENEVADLTRQLNRLEKSTGNEKLEKAFATLQTKTTMLEADIKALTKERATLKKQLESRSTAMPTLTKSDARGDEKLREELKQLAAQVVHMTAMVEGKGSRIDELVSAATPASKGGVISLAQRIKALKKAAEAAE